MVAAVVAMFFGTFLGMCIYARVKATRSLAEDLRVRSLVDAAQLTTVRDAPLEGSILLSGRVSGAASALVTAPFSGDDVLWARAAARSNVGSLIDEWIRSVDEIVLDDGSGRVASLRLAGAAVRLDEVNVSGAGSETTQRIAAFLASTGRPPSTSSRHVAEFYYEAALRPGDTISILATVATGAGEAYRASGGALTLTNEAGELLLFDGDKDAGAPALHRGYIRAANFGIAFFGLATLISIAIAVLA
jgi:hypothetical protein